MTNAKSCVIIDRYKRCGCCSMVEFQPSKLAAWVRFPSPAPFFCAGSSVDRVPGYEPVGRGFESPPARQQKQPPNREVAFVFTLWGLYENPFASAKGFVTPDLRSKVGIHGKKIALFTCVNSFYFLFAFFGMWTEYIRCVF